MSTAIYKEKLEPITYALEKTLLIVYGYQLNTYYFI